MLYRGISITYSRVNKKFSFCKFCNNCGGWEKLSGGILQFGRQVVSTSSTTGEKDAEIFETAERKAGTEPKKADTEPVEVPAGGERRGMNLVHA